MGQRIPPHKGVFILPNLFTTGSLFTAFLGLVWASQGRFDDCAIAIFISALMDGLDGKVARLTGTSSEFGVQYDSLCDLVAFGVTPAFMMFKLSLYQFNRLGIAVCFLFTVCAALRLARFNVAASLPANKRFFIGLPTPAAGCALAIFVLVQPFIPDFMHGIVPVLSLLITGAVGLLMVSRIRYAAFKEFGFFRVHPFRYMVFAIVLFALIVSNPKLFGFLLIYGYILSGLVYTFSLLPKHRSSIDRKTPPPTAS